MKAFIKTLILASILFTTSCEDVIDVTVPTAKPRLIIEASLDWQKGTTGNFQTIKLSTLSPYFDTSGDNAVTGATVKVTNTNSGAEYIFEDQNNGIYIINDFVPVVNDTYTLEVVYNQETYMASETLYGVPEITNTEQSVEGGFDDEVLDINIYWDDPEDEENYYFIKFIEQGDLLPILNYQSDEFTNGNEMDDFFEKGREDDDDQAELNPGDTVSLCLFGVSERYYNYLRLIINQYDSGGDTFSPPPSEIRGNCINTTNEANYPYGYFRLTEFDAVTYTFQ